MKSVLIFLAVCGFVATSKVPIHRAREELGEETASSVPPTTPSTPPTPTTKAPPIICEPQTACSWTTYKPGAEKIELEFIPNTYCICEPDTVCQVDYDDTSSNTYIHRCRPPVTEEEAGTSES